VFHRQENRDLVKHWSSATNSAEVDLIAELSKSAAKTAASNKVDGAVRSVNGSSPTLMSMNQTMGDRMAKKFKRATCKVCGVETGYIGDRPCDWCSQPKPAVGMGVTYGCWTDRHAGTIIEVSPSGKTIKVQDDIAKRVDNNGMSECQSYEHSPNPNGQIHVFKITNRKGRKAWRSGNYVAGLGNRRTYHDYSF
jgi:hypothetical protein